MDLLNGAMQDDDLTSKNDFIHTMRYDGICFMSDGNKHVIDALTVEHPLSVSINDEPFTLTMQTPGHEFDLVRGLLFTEGVYKKKSGQLIIDVKEESETGFISKVNVVIPESDLDKSQLNKRNLLSVASCGICGKTELTFPDTAEIKSTAQLNMSFISDMFHTMSAAQTAFMQSGGCHAAATFDREHEMLTIKEDIGRHNAVDKVIGHLLNNSELKNATYLLVSGRVSYEIVSKAFMAGIPFLMAVSAPSSLAVDFAKELGITLLGFCREDRATVYSHPERLTS